MKNLSTSDAFPELKMHASFDLNEATLEHLMLKGEDEGAWVNICEKVGLFLATTRPILNSIDVGKVFPNDSIRKKSTLGEWVAKMNNSCDDIKSIVPDDRSQHLDMERIRERGKQAAEILQNADNLNFENLVTKNFQLLPDQKDIQINFSEVDLVYGPLGLETAVFLADILVNYHQQLTLDHSIRYVTSDCAKSYGRAYDSKANLSELESKKFWAQTSLLAGWEIIRRVSEDETLHELSRQKQLYLWDVFEAGLRLVYNGHIDNIGYMIIVALAEI